MARQIHRARKAISTAFWLRVSTVDIVCDLGQQEAEIKYVFDQSDYRIRVWKGQDSGTTPLHATFCEVGFALQASSACLAAKALIFKVSSKGIFQK